MELLAPLAINEAQLMLMDLHKHPGKHHQNMLLTHGANRINIHP